MEGGGLGVRIERKSSIESEPRTLTIDQIQYAREAALYVVNTRSEEEAVSIFTEGLQPVVSVAQSAGEAMDLDGEIKCIHAHLQLLAGIRDVLSAPF
ncbi:uncharacterized protein LOC110628895 [Manihot esculenta]|uniref:Uncharacterized protein n=1 Tax=Manihot esculenta TaxID=3983 RepID=A0A2C9UYB5_MANES|nr:uncharacterized protein LOC110628895 [Manihot esculenta]OAY36084.1 hypothetical protein MANES_12G154600v8 [Manihot esculenta]